MSHSMNEFDCEGPMDVPTMMRVLMAVYESTRDDIVLDEVAVSVNDAICRLMKLRAMAHQVMAEGDTAAQLTPCLESDIARKLC